MGYDKPLIVEHEDVLVNWLERVSRSAKMLERIVLSETPDWKPAHFGSTPPLAAQVCRCVIQRESSS
ncbi:hypothetical protein ACVW00_000065 [Marmoricola sp. URHA0025 HA25]